MNNKQNDFGRHCEFMARTYLEQQGYLILETNWRSGHKEIDLIAKERDILVFVEVKTRRNENFGDAYEAVTPQKMRNIIAAAEAYIKKHEIDASIRFDIVTIVGNGERHEIEHIKDAFYPGIE